MKGHCFISSIRVQGFKSFPSSSSEFGLSPYVTGIVGCNGSGKSNVLDALCFASACPVEQLRVRLLHEVAGTDAEACCVDFDIGDSEDASYCHNIKASLNPQGHRVHQIDGKLKTASQVKEFLWGHNLRLDCRSAVIKQAEVTRIADANKPSQLAEIIASASGLARWQQESEKALQELKSTHLALAEIDADMQKLQAAIGVDRQTAAAQVRLSGVEKDIQAVAGRVAAGLGQAKLQAQQQLQISKARQEELSVLQQASHAEAGRISEEIKALEVAWATEGSNSTATHCAGKGKSSTGQKTGVAAGCTADAAAVALTEQQLSRQRRLVLQLSRLRVEGVGRQAAADQLQQQLEEAREAEAEALGIAAQLSSKTQEGTEQTAACTSSSLTRQRLQRASLQRPAGSSGRVTEAQHDSRGQQRRMRIWPLDRLQAQDRCAQQRAAQLHFGADKVFLPLDLLSYQHRYHSALLRAFGGYLIVADNATAAAVVTKYRLSSITLAGKVTHWGSLTGGWSDSGPSPNLRLLSNKLRHDTLTCELTQQQLHLQRLDNELQTLEARQSDARNVRENAEAAAADLDSKQQELGCLVAEAATLQATILLAQAGLRSVQQEKGIQEQVLHLQELESVEWQAAASPSVEALVVRLQQQRDRGHRLAAERDSLAARAAQVEQQRKAQKASLQLARARQAACSAKMSQQDTEARSAERQSQHLSREVTQASSSLSLLLQQHPDACVAGFVEASGHGNMDPAATAGGVAGSIRSTGLCADESSSKDVAAGFVKLQTQLQALMKEKNKLDREQAPVLELAQHKDRAESVLQLAGQAEMLRKAVSMLERIISDARGQVLENNQEVFGRVAAAFAVSTADLLPGLKFRLRCVGASADDGVLIMFCRPPQGQLENCCKLMHSSGAAAWSSCGQRTLVSLALLLEAAHAGAHSSVFLLDEVDAALDESNQAAIAALLHQLSHGTAPTPHHAVADPDSLAGAVNNGAGKSRSAACRGQSADKGGKARVGCQMLCVSHNPAFQEACDGVVRVTRGPGGTAVEVV
ncbi:MAG: hypothetical protein WDW38_005635 [Sanguina aurantia]